MFIECDGQNITSSVENSKPGKEIEMVDIVCACMRERERETD
jgi:hypothetical protein